MTYVTPKHQDKANYGFDAPDIMKGMLASSVVLVGGGVTAATLLPWGYAAEFCVILSILGVIPLFLGSIMFFYGLFGKYRTRDYMLSLIQWRGDEVVLDIGTGAGLLAIGAAKLLNQGGRAIGIDTWSEVDLSNNSENTAIRNITIEGVTERVELRTEDARQLRFDDESVDHVLSLHCLHNIEPQADQDEACREIARVLRPGGRAVIGDYIPTHRYASVLQEASLNVIQSKAEFAIAKAPVWILVAEKCSPKGVVGT